MMIPATIEELATLVNREGKTVFLSQLTGAEIVVF